MTKDGDTTLGFPPAAIGHPVIWRSGGAVLAESLVWQNGSLHWCDIPLGTLHIGSDSGAVDGSDDRVIRFDPPLASFQPRAGGGFVLALGADVVVCDETGDERRVLARISHAHAGIRNNEGKVDPTGAFQVGSMNMTTGEPDAAVYRVLGDGSVSTIRGGFGTANGFEWSADGTVAYLTDTSSQTVYRAPWTAEAGPGELQPWAVGRMHDGLTLDRDGFLWSGVYGDGAVVRLSPEGDVVERVEVPAPNVTSVVFGGDDGSVLLIATARGNLSEQDLERWPLSGGIFALRTRTAGYPVRSFAG
ncbi:SMP-30/gluconolactonase/LRE family protein [Naasia lichenicola]|uniref:SMP-30/gluconolactonase/LRE family protein n=1 Tax=Naasia lichenicola TaxID=2565933 RepID=A0A4S4FP86_9MICO|nr:SMP-30/gluconolactonase/LRE family protein [Naasia lichenicola]THG32349.1 SMP-30/gluconolactonase/LRE family protein [Naasia lichenicola]